MTYEYSSYLEHHGIPGMKWGKWNEETRKRYTGTGGERNKSKPESRTWKAKEASHLSNEELDRRNTRLQKENQYRTNVENAHPVKKEVKQSAKKILLYSAVGVMSGIAAVNYKNGASFIGKFMKYKLPL